MLFGGNLKELGVSRDVHREAISDADPAKVVDVTARPKWFRSGRDVEVALGGQVPSAR